MKKGILCFLTALLLASCGAEKDGKGISEETVQSLLAEVKTADKELLERGVRQTAALWTEEDGSEAEFTVFVKENFASDAQAKEVLFNKLSKATEIINGAYNQLVLDLQKPTTLSGEEPENIDYPKIRNYHPIHD